jgi:hypothetical protein
MGSCPRAQNDGAQTFLGAGDPLGGSKESSVYANSVDFVVKGLAAKTSAPILPG